MMNPKTLFKLMCDEVSEDPKILTAKKQILETFVMHCKKIETIRPPQTVLRQSYEELIVQLEKFRGIPLWHPYLGTGIGNGALVELADGSIKYDFISGIGTHFSHAHPQLLEAALDGALQNISMQGNLQQNKDSYDLLENLLKVSGMDHCILTTSGAMANENALKLAFHKKNSTNRIIAFEKTFIGRTLVLSQISDKASYREGLPSNIFVDYIPFYDPQAPEKSTSLAINSLKKILRRYPNKHGCCCIELIQGEAGYYPGDTHFFLPLMEIIAQENIPILIDEVQTFGRTDHFFAFQHFGLAKYADIVTVGKLLHTCATLYKSAFKPKQGLISQTFTSSSVSIRVSAAILRILQEGAYLGKEGMIMKLSNHFISHLKRLCQKYPEKIKGPFGYGLMIAFTPFSGRHEEAIKLVKLLFEEGVICFIGGNEPTRVRFHLPIGGVSINDIDHVVSILEKIIT